MREGTSGVATRRLWWRAFGALAVACACWALTMPLFAGPDESSHATRAAAVARGQLSGEGGYDATTGHSTGAWVHVPGAYQSSGRMACIVLDPRLSAACAPEFKGGNRLARVATDEHRGFPLYYGLVGLPTLVFPTVAGAYLMRLVSSTIAAALMASGIVSVAEARHGSLAAVGLFVAIAPEVLNLSGTINLNAIEIAAAICLWSSLLAVVRAAGGIGGRVVIRIGLSLTVLMVSRGLSLLFAMLALAAFGALSDRQVLRRLLRRNDVRRWGAVVGVAALAGAGWIAFVQNAYPLGRSSVALGRVWRNMPTVLSEAVGVFNTRALGPLNHRNIPLPAAIYVVWAAAVLAVLVVAFLAMQRREALVVLGLAAVALAMPITTDAYNIPSIGIPWQGRYGLPLLVGVVIVASGLSDVARRFPPAAVGVVSRVSAMTFAALCVAQVLAFVSTTRRFTVGGAGSHNPLRYLLDPTWSPPAAPALVFVGLFAMSVSYLAILLWRVQRATLVLRTPADVSR